MNETNEQPSGSPLASPSCYAKRDLEELGRYYFRHLNAMTREGLHSKSDIAAELATRDMIIDDLEFWREMPAQEMRLRCGEMSAQEIRTVRAVLSIILSANGKDMPSAGGETSTIQTTE